MSKRFQLAGVGLLIALVFYFLGGKTARYDGGGQVRQGNYQFTNPLLECNVSGISAPKKNFEKSVAKLIDQMLRDGLIKHAAFYYRDLNNGPVFGLNHQDTYFPGSLGKLPLAMAIYKMAESRPSVLSEKIVYDNFETPPAGLEYISTSTVLSIGESYRLEELIDLMLRYSDNQAAFLLYTYADKRELDTIYQFLGIDGDVLTANKDGQIGVRQYSSFLRILYNASYLSGENSNTILKTLSRAEFTEGLRAGVPTSIPIANKFGIAESQAGLPQMHDCGIIYVPNKPYLLCIMTEGNRLEQLYEAIAKISALVYQERD
ncbi:MAG TPA: serine hydrolase [Candidatus Paceibacterota bacterium]